MEAWRTITSAADPWLDMLDMAKLQENVVSREKQTANTYGNLLLRVIDHYWYHLGENMAIRQMLGRNHLPQFVGSIDDQASYRLE